MLFNYGMYLCFVYIDIGSSRKDVESFCTALEDKVVCARTHARTHAHTHTHTPCNIGILMDTHCDHIENISSNCTGKACVPEYHTGM